VSFAQSFAHDSCDVTPELLGVLHGPYDNLSAKRSVFDTLGSIGDDPALLTAVDDTSTVDTLDLVDEVDSGTVLALLGGETAPARRNVSRDVDTLK